MAECKIKTPSFEVCLRYRKCLSPQWISCHVTVNHDAKQLLCYRLSQLRMPWIDCEKKIVSSSVLIFPNNKFIHLSINRIVIPQFMHFLQPQYSSRSVFNSMNPNTLKGIIKDDNNYYYDLRRLWEKCVRGCEIMIYEGCERTIFVIDRFLWFIVIILRFRIVYLLI